MLFLLGAIPLAPGNLKQFFCQVWDMVLTGFLRFAPRDREENFAGDGKKMPGS